MKKVFGWALILMSTVLYLLAANVVAAYVQYSLYGLWLTFSDADLLMTFVATAAGAFALPIVVNYFGYRLIQSAPQPAVEVQPLNTFEKPTRDGLTSSASTGLPDKALDIPAPTVFPVTAAPTRSAAVSTAAQLCAERLKRAGWNVGAVPKGWLIQKGFGSSRLIKDQEELVYFCLCNSLVTQDELSAIANGSSLVTT
jgi:hypothetical protein